MSEELMKMAFKVVGAVAAPLLETVGDAVAGEDGARVGRAAGEFVREVLR